MPVDEYAKSVGARLRLLRERAGLTLKDVEEQSAGRWKSVVVSSYERGDRAMTVTKLAGLAAFYHVHVADLLPADVPEDPNAALPRLTMDMQHVHDDFAAPDGTPLGGYAAVVRSQRAGRSRKVLTIWPEGLRILSAVCGLPVDGPAPGPVDPAADGESAPAAAPADDPAPGGAPM